MTATNVAPASFFIVCCIASPRYQGKWSGFGIALPLPLFEPSGKDGQPIVIKFALPPAAAVFTLTERSVSSRSSA